MGKQSDMNRRRFLRKLGLGAAVMAGVPVIPCTACETCLKKCPQQIRIPNQMARIVETLKRR